MSSTCARRCGPRLMAACHGSGTGVRPRAAGASRSARRSPTSACSGNVRTEESTVRSIAGISIGDTLETDTLDMVRERLNTAGLFADVNVWWEPHGSGVRVNISVKDKFPWAPVPTGSWSANNKALGLLFVHGNLFGRGKQLVLGGALRRRRLGRRDRLPRPVAVRVAGSTGSCRRSCSAACSPNTTTTDTSANPAGVPRDPPGVVGVRAGGGHRLVPAREDASRRGASRRSTSTRSDAARQHQPRSSSRRRKGGMLGVGRANLTFDFRSREFAVMRGAALAGQLDFGGPDFGGDFKYWKRGRQLGTRHQVLQGATTSSTSSTPPPATTCRSAHEKRRRAATTCAATCTSSSAATRSWRPRPSITSRCSRSARSTFARSASTTSPRSGSARRRERWWAPTPARYIYIQRDTPDLRTFRAATPVGFTFDDSIHTAVGGGLRFFLRSVAVPLVGFDAGYGIEARTWRFILLVGA